MSKYKSLPVAERARLHKLYKKAYPNMSYQDIISDFDKEDEPIPQYALGGETNPPDTDPPVKYGTPEYKKAYEEGKIVRVNPDGSYTAPMMKPFEIVTEDTRVKNAVRKASGDFAKDYVVPTMKGLTSAAVAPVGLGIGLFDAAHSFYEGDNVGGVIGAGMEALPYGVGKVIKHGKPLLKQTGKYLTTQTPLKNAHKINPWAFKPNPEAYYRGIGRSGLDDAINTKTLRTANKTGNYGEDLYVTKDFRIAKGNYSKDQDYGVGDPFGDNWHRISAKDKKSYIAEIPEQSFTNKKNVGNSDIAINKGALPIDDINFYKEDWLKGYKQLDVPKQLPGSGSKFKSEIDWSKWNKEIPENKALMSEYNSIEQTAKANGSWMKNSDGSSFQGTPEQFVQQNSENFKKAFGNTKVRDAKGNIQIAKHTTNTKFDEFNMDKFGSSTDDGFYGKGSYFHPASNDMGNYGDIQMNTYLNIQNPAPKEIIPFFGRDGKGRLMGSKSTHNNEELWKGKYDGVIADNKHLDVNYREFNDTEYVTNIPSNIKSATGNNGMFDMTNPNIYKGLVPAALIGSQALQEKAYGGNISQYATGGTIGNNPTKKSVQYVDSDFTGDKDEKRFMYLDGKMYSYNNLKAKGLDPAVIAYNFNLKKQREEEVVKKEENQTVKENTPVVNASANSMTFNQAFAQARKEGLQKFVYNGKTYGTSVAKKAPVASTTVIPPTIAAPTPAPAMTAEEFAKVAPFTAKYQNMTPAELEREKKKYTVSAPYVTAPLIGGRQMLHDEEYEDHKAMGFKHPWRNIPKNPKVGDKALMSDFYVVQKGNEAPRATAIPDLAIYEEWDGDKDWHQVSGKNTKLRKNQELSTLLSDVKFKDVNPDKLMRTVAALDSLTTVDPKYIEPSFAKHLLWNEKHHFINLGNNIVNLKDNISRLSEKRKPTEPVQSGSIEFKYGGTIGNNPTKPKPAVEPYVAKDEADYKYRQQMYSDSLNLHKYSELQKQLEGYKPAKRPYMGSLQGEIDFYKNKGKDARTEFPHRYPSDKTLVNLGNEISKTNPNNFYWFQKGLSPDLAHKKIEPIGMYDGKAYNYEYKKPVQQVLPPLEMHGNVPEGQGEFRRRLTKIVPEESQQPSRPTYERMPIRQPQSDTSRPGMQRMNVPEIPQGYRTQANYSYPNITDIYENGVPTYHENQAGQIIPYGSKFSTGWQYGK
jgi:hypothetical protein